MHLRLPCLLGLLLPLASAVAACSDCDRRGCTLLTRNAAQQGTGIAGVVAQETDVVMNGCQECPFSDATLDVWRLDAPVPEAEVPAQLNGRRPDVTQLVSGTYVQALDAGPHVVCVTNSCVRIDVVADDTLTLNIKLLFGPTKFFIERPDSDAMSEEMGFDITPGTTNQEF